MEVGDVIEFNYKGRLTFGEVIRWHQRKVVRVGYNVILIRDFLSSDYCKVLYNKKDER